MKKISIVTLLVMAVIFLGGSVNAVTTDTLAEELYSLGSKYGMTSADKVKIERYLADYPVTDEEANDIIAKANDAVKIMEESSITNYTELTKSQKDKLKTIANEAASIIDVTLTFKDGAVEIYKEGKLIETVTSNNGKLAYTGNKANIALVVSLVAIVALTLGFTVRKKFANA